MPSIYQVDAFTDRPFAGNPAAVCLLDEPADDTESTNTWLQQVAAEMNLAETAFLHRAAGGFNLRWMTPTVEVDLCGHATLAAAHILWERGHVSSTESISFFTRNGTLVAHRRDDLIELDFPQKPATACPPPETLLTALEISGDDVQFAGRNEFDWLIVVADSNRVRALNPDFRRLAQIDVRGVIVTAADESGEFDFISRFFAPSAGIDEDPVTGSAHVCLGPYWRDRLEKNPLRGYQASARGGVVGVCLQGDRTLLTGNAVTVLEGKLTC
jgi:PhzF family phenazine biosynthesis protein